MPNSDSFEVCAAEDVAGLKWLAANAVGMGQGEGACLQFAVDLGLWEVGRVDEWWGLRLSPQRSRIGIGKGCGLSLRW